MIRAFLTLMLIFVAGHAQAQSKQEAPFSDQIYFLAKHYVERVEILERKIDELMAKCGDRCTPLVPQPSVEGSPAPLSK